MASVADLTKQLNDVKDQLTALNTQVAKVATEEAGLQTQVADLKAQLAAAIAAGGTVTPELQAAADGVSAAAGTLGTAVKGLDDLVPG